MNIFGPFFGKDEQVIEESFREKRERESKEAQAKIDANVAKAKAGFPDTLKRYKDELTKHQQEFNITAKCAGSFLIIEGESCGKKIAKAICLSDGGFELCNGGAPDESGSAYATQHGHYIGLPHMAPFGGHKWIDDAPQPYRPDIVKFRDGQKLRVPFGLGKQAFDILTDALK